MALIPALRSVKVLGAHSWILFAVPMLVAVRAAGAIGAYAWNFGDGTTSSVQNPPHVYSAAGVYTVSLTVTGPGGSNTQTLSNYITISTAAVAPGHRGIDAYQ